MHYFPVCEEWLLFSVMWKSHVHGSKCQQARGKLLLNTRIQSKSNFIINNLRNRASQVSTEYSQT